MKRLPSPMLVAALVAALTTTHATAGRAQTDVFGPSAGALTGADRTFLSEDAQGARYELALAQQAQQSSMRSDVKAYASRVASDHREYNEALDRLTDFYHVDVPVSLRQADRDRLDQMSEQTGDEYDRAFIVEAIRINGQDKKDSAAEDASTRVADIRVFMRKFAAMDDLHEKGALALRP